MLEPRFEATDGLTRDDIAAFRVSTDWSLHLGAKIGSMIRLYCDGDRSKGDVAIYTTRQQILFPVTSDYQHKRIREITVNATVQGYGDFSNKGAWRWNRGMVSDGVPSAFESLSRELDLGTIARSLREDDILHLWWEADNNSDLVREANLHVDQVSLIARHPNLKKPGNRWLLGTAVCRDNSARMIRRHG
jgi:hypothetical protein